MKLTAPQRKWMTRMLKEGPQSVPSWDSYGTITRMMERLQKAGLVQPARLTGLPGSGYWELTDEGRRAMSEPEETE